MNTTLLILLLLPLFIPIAAKFVGGNTFEWKVVPIVIVISTILTVWMFYSGRGLKTLDTEILNGEVTNKQRNKVSCSHSYPCNCRPSCSGSGNSRSCSTVCQTCYEHSYDVDWDVYSNIGGFTISREDQQGLREPKRWSIVENGQPVARTNVYTNYVKAVPQSLFHANNATENAKFASQIPTYPIGVYDYQYVDRVIPIGLSVPDLRQWNTDLALALRKLGPQKQANVVIVMVKNSDPNYAYALRDAWMNSKKNDIVVIFGVTEYPKIEWVRILSWTDKELFKVQLRDELLETKELDRTKVIPLISQHTMSTFHRKSMKDFAYLEAEIDPPEWMIYLLIGILVIGNFGVAGVIRYDAVKRELWRRRCYEA